MKAFTVKSLLNENYYNNKKISIQCVIRRGIPTIKILGISHQKSNELAIKLQTIFAINQINLPYENIQVNISSNSIKQYTNHLELSIFMSIFLSIYKEYAQIFEPIDNTLFIGELSLLGDIEKIEDFKKYLLNARKIGFKKILLSFKHYDESIQFDDLEYIFINNIKDLIENKLTFSKGLLPIKIQEKHIDNIKIPKAIIKLFPVLAGKHSIYMIEKQNINKTELLKNINYFLPSLNQEEIEDILSLNKEQHNLNRPYVQISSNITKKEFLGDKVYNGILYEHQKGILLFENINSFHQDILLSIKELIEKNQIKLNHFNININNDYWIIITSKTCLCGNLYNPLKECTCNTKQIKNFYQKFKLILKDYIDVIYFIDHEYINIKNNIINLIRRKMQKAYELQQERFKNESYKFNAQITDDKIELYCDFQDSLTHIYWEKLTEYLSENEKKIIRRIARSIADYHNNLRITIRDLQISFDYRKSLNYIEDLPIQQHISDSLK